VVLHILDFIYLKKEMRKMKERKHYEVPSITVINMDAENDIIQTSGEMTASTFSNIGQAKRTTYADISDLFSN